MTFEVPDLNTVSAVQLLDELVARIPRVVPNWTEQNSSDPGMTLLEMLAWIVEATAYQANCIPFEAYLCKVRFILGLAFSAETTRPYTQPAIQGLDPWYEQLQRRLQTAEADGASDFQTLRESVFDFRSRPYLASTQSAIEVLAKEANRYLERTDIANRYRILDAFARYLDGMVELGLVVGDPAVPFLEYGSELMTTASFCTVTRSLSPDVAAGDGAVGQVSETVETVRQYVSPRSLLGNPISIRSASCMLIAVQCAVRCTPRACPDDVAERIAQAIIDWMQPYSPGARIDAPSYGVVPTEASLLSVFAAVEGIYAVESLMIDEVPAQGGGADAGAGAGLGVGPLLTRHFKGHPLGTGGVTILGNVQVTARVFSS